MSTFAKDLASSRTAAGSTSHGAETGQGVPDGNGRTRIIDLGKDFGDVVVKANGAQVKIGADGSIHGLPAAANSTAAKDKTGSYFDYHAGA